MLLRKLGKHNRKSRLYCAFRELGRVERTLFLLRYISSTEMRLSIRAETTKVESFNDFLDWISFGGTIIKSGDPVEQEKQLKYASLVANAIMLNNVVDLTDVLSSMLRAILLHQNLSLISVLIYANIFAASANMTLIWMIYLNLFLRHRCPSRKSYDYFLHVSSTDPRGPFGVLWKQWHSVKA